MFKRYWTMCPKYDDHSRLNSQHNWGGLTLPFSEHDNPHFQWISYSYKLENYEN